MSIIIAKNCNDLFYIISDTKITLDDDKIPCQIKDPLKSNLKKFGTIKTIIIKGVVALAFAGEDISLADDLILKLKELIYTDKEKTLQDIYELVKYEYDSAKNKNGNSHKCDYILAVLNQEKVSLFCFKDDINTKEVERCYIGDYETYKLFCDRDLEKSIPIANYVDKNKIYIESDINIKMTLEGEIEQKTEKMKEDMIKLKEIVDLGYKNDYKHKSTVGSPIVGVYLNTQRNQFEYYYDIIYNSHIEMKPDGTTHAITISEYSNGEYYTITPFKHTEGIIINYHFLKYSVSYIYTDYYLKLGIKDYNNLLLPIVFAGYIDEKLFTPLPFEEFNQ